MSRRELAEIVVDGALVAAAALAHFLDVTPVLQFILAALAIAGLARLVGSSTEQLGGRVGAAGAGVIQSALGNLPELFIALFALHDRLVKLVQAALIGSILANSVLVLGLAFTVGGLRNGTQTFNSPRARMIATLTVLAAAILSMPSLANAFHAPAAAHSRTLSFVCAGVLLGVFVLTLPGLLAPLPNEAEHEPPRWSLRTTLVVLLGAAIAAAVASDWFVSALQPAIKTLRMSESFAGLVVVAIAGNAVENVVGVQLAARNRPDFAIAVIVNSSLQVALALTPALVFLSLFFGTTLTPAFPTLLAISLLLASRLATRLGYDGESTWPEGVILIGLYIVIAASFWWGA